MGFGMTAAITSVTKKGQATIPKKVREKFGIKDKVIVFETSEGILLKPLPKPEDDFGSLRKLFKGKTSREILVEARREEVDMERRLLERL
jgi:AbrB family looped-hinge helix DNA binding protein